MPEALRIRGEADGPSAYATRLSTYLTDAKYIHAMTLREYGKAPAIAHIQRQIDRHRKSKEAFEKERHLGGANYIPDNDNGEHFRVRGLVAPERKEVARVPRTPKPRHELTNEDRTKGGMVAGEQTTANFKKRLSDSFAPSKACIKAAAEWFDIEPDTVRSGSRHGFVISARYVAIKLMHDMRYSDGSPRFTLPMIAKAIGYKDHTTVCHAIATFEHRARKYPEMLEAYEALKDG